LVHEMSLRQKGTYAPPQDKAWGLNIHDGEWALAPYDQNKLSNHKLSIAKPLNMSRSYKGIYSQESIHVTFFKNIAINHGYKSRSSRAKPN
jgi:hypothetical protein